MGSYTAQFLFLVSLSSITLPAKEVGKMKSSKSNSFQRARPLKNLGLVVNLLWISFLMKWKIGNGMENWEWNGEWEEIFGKGESDKPAGMYEVRGKVTYDFYQDYWGDYDSSTDLDDLVVTYICTEEEYYGPPKERDEIHYLIDRINDFKWHVNELSKLIELPEELNQAQECLTKLQSRWDNTKLKSEYQLEDA